MSLCLLSCCHVTPIPSPHPLRSVISITTHSAVLSSQDAPLNKLSKSGLFGSRRTDGARQGSWFAFFLKSVLFLGLCVGGVQGYKAYVRRGRHGGFAAPTGGNAFGGLGMDGDRSSYGSRRRF